MPWAEKNKQTKSHKNCLSLPVLYKLRNAAQYFAFLLWCSKWSSYIGEWFFLIRTGLLCSTSEQICKKRVIFSKSGSSDEMGRAPEKKKRPLVNFCVRKDLGKDPSFLFPQSKSWIVQPCVIMYIYLDRFVRHSWLIQCSSCVGLRALDIRTLQIINHNRVRSGDNIAG